MQFQKTIKRLGLIYAIFWVSLFILPRFGVRGFLLEGIAWTFTSAIVFLYSLYVLSHPSELIGYICSRRLKIFSKLPPKPGDEPLIMIMSLGLAIFSLWIFLFSGIIPLIVLLSHYL